jgi:RNA polymerase sigma-70 factor (ECF subfamily)
MSTTFAANDLDDVFARHRSELRGHCARLLGSTRDAEDAVQDTFVRGWRHVNRFEGRSSLRTWLYRIATNVCLDMLRDRRRAEIPVDEARLDARAVGSDPADAVVDAARVREALAIAFARLPERQRAVLVLRDALRWDAREVAQLLDLSVPATNSLLQRARATLAGAAGPAPSDRGVAARVEALADALARTDLDRVVRLLAGEARGSGQ